MRNDRRKADLLYVRAKAQRMLDDFSGALTTADNILEAISFDDSNPEFMSEVLQFRFDLLVRVRPPGDPARIAAADKIANHARKYELPANWAFGEGSVLQERIFAAAAGVGRSDELQIERAERALSQLSSELEQALRLQSILANAYTFRAISSLDEDDIAQSVALLEDIASSIPAIDRLAIISNILISWMRLTASNHDSGALFETIKRIVKAGQVILEEPIQDAQRPDLEARNLLREASEVYQTSSRYINFLEVESSADMAARSRVAGELESWARHTRQQSIDGSNLNWAIPILLEAAALLRTSLAQFPEAAAGYRVALASIETARISASLGRQILENLYASLCMANPPDAFCEIGKRDAAAAAWTAIVEKSIIRGNADASSAAHRALIAFEKECFGVAEQDGRVRSIGEARLENWETERRDADAALRKSGLPEFDSAEFPIDTSTRLSFSAATVVLCSGRSSGYALIVPPGSRVKDAISVELPGYSARAAERLAMSRADGWVPTLLNWRSSHGFGPFDLALRRTAVRLWESAVGRVYEALENLGCLGKVDLVVRGNQRLFPWGCAAPTNDLSRVFADAVELSTGFDLSTLLLGHSRGEQGGHEVSLQKDRIESRASLLVAAPFLGIPIETAMSLAISPDAAIEVLSITDGMADLPMTRLEGDAARLAFPNATLALEGGIDPRAAPFLFPLIQAAKVLHVACHGVWMPTHPWASAVMLGPAYAMFAATVRARLQLNGSLVVLSACESGIGGPTAAGEGGLVQAFLLAGARSVVASSWMVDDLSSLVFSASFFAQLGKTGNVFDATRFARKSTREATAEDLLALVERLGEIRPDVRPTLLKNLEQVAAAEAVPFKSPVHWGAQFVAMTGR